MALVSGIVAGVSGIVAGASKAVEGAQAKKAADQQALELNKQAIELERRGEIRKKRLRREGDRFLGDQTAAIAASGVEVSGSPLAGLIESERSIKEELSDLDVNIKQEATALRTGAFRTQEQGRRAMRAGAIGAATSFLGTAQDLRKRPGGLNLNG